MVTYKFYNKLFSDRLKEVFGKDTFTEDELTQDFYTDLKIKCADFFKNEEGAFDSDLFWSEGLRNWLLQEK